MLVEKKNQVMTTTARSQTARLWIGHDEQKGHVSEPHAPPSSLGISTPPETPRCKRFP